MSQEAKYQDQVEKIVSYYRDLLRTLAEDAMEDVQALSGSDYERMYDYDWTIW